MYLPKHPSQSYKRFFKTKSYQKWQNSKQPKLAIFDSKTPDRTSTYTIHKYYVEAHDPSFPLATLLHQLLNQVMIYTPTHIPLLQTLTNAQKIASRKRCRWLLNTLLLRPLAMWGKVLQSVSSRVTWDVQCLWRTASDIRGKHSKMLGAASGIPANSLARQRQLQI